MFNQICLGKTNKICSPPLNISFCEVWGTPVACVRASARSLTVGLLSSSCPVTVMLCFVEPGMTGSNHN